MDNLPLIGTGKTAKQIGNFAKKEQKEVDTSIFDGTVIPYVYYWEQVDGGKSVTMTMAFKIHGKLFGMTYPIEDQNVVKINMLREKLFNVVKESLDVLFHHGVAVLDEFGQINPVAVNEQEAIKFKYDQFWDKKVAAFNKLVRIKPITMAEALRLKLLDTIPQ